MDNKTISNTTPPQLPKLDSLFSNGLNSFKDDTFYIYGLFDESIAKEIIPNLVKQINEKKNIKGSKIKFYIDSNGGYARYLYNLLSLIEQAKKEDIIVETNVYGYAYSCGSLLACAGTKGHRNVSILAEHLCHLGQAGTGSVINDTELERMGKKVKNHFDIVRTLYKKYAKIKNLEKVLHDDCYFIRGKDIIKNGLADNIVD
jgi:ATP-dependent protease ClpP protease subunit